jgi:hypothetical protein
MWQAGMVVPNGQTQCPKVPGDRQVNVGVGGGIHRQCHDQVPAQGLAALGCLMVCASGHGSVAAAMRYAMSLPASLNVAGRAARERSRPSRASLGAKQRSSMTSAEFRCPAERNSSPPAVSRWMVGFES